MGTIDTSEWENEETRKEIKAVFGNRKNWMRYQMILNNLYQQLYNSLI